MMSDKLRAAAKAVLESTKSLFLCCSDFSHLPQDLHPDGKCIPWGRYNDALTALDDALAEQETDAYGYASRLAVALSEKHYKTTAANWKPLPDLMGVLTQIDNMTASLVRQQAEPEQEPVAWYHNDFGVLEFSRHERVGWSPLYAAPLAEPEQKLIRRSDEEINAQFNRHLNEMEKEWREKK